MRRNKTRLGVVSLLVMASVIGGIVLTETASAQSLSIEEVTTTEGDELTGDPVISDDDGSIAKGQGMEVTVGYENIPASPSSPQEILVVSDEPDVFGSDAFRSLGTSFTVTSQSGTRTVTIPYSNIEDLSFPGFFDPDFQPLPGVGELQAKWRSGGETKANSDLFYIGETPTTIYIDNAPDLVNDGEEATVDFYGWSEKPTVFPKLFTASGDPIDTFGQESPNPRFSGTITFTPSDEATAGETLDIQLGTQAGDGPKSNVESVSISEASINSVSQQSGSFTTGEDVSATVTVTNTGQQDNTFFVGYSAAAPNGDFFDNQGTTGKTVTLASGEQKTLTVDWTVQNAAPSGQYDTIVSVWRESDRTNLQTRLDTVRKQNAFTVTDQGGSLSSNNPFGDSNGNPVGRQTVINRVVQWNLNSEINGTSYTRQEIINFVVQWNLAN